MYKTDNTSPKAHTGFQKSAKVQPRHVELTDLLHQRPPQGIKRVVLISCVSKKQTLVDGETVPAKNLYLSPLFRKSWQYAQRIHADRIFILSAKHHLLHPETEVGSYNQTLNTASSSERRTWAKKVLMQLQAEGVDLQHDEVVLLAGKRYYQYLLGKNGIQNAVHPFGNCTGIGFILQALTHV